MIALALVVGLFIVFVGSLTFVLWLENREAVMRRKHREDCARLHALQTAYSAPPDELGAAAVAQAQKPDGFTWNSFSAPDVNTYMRVEDDSPTYPLVDPVDVASALGAVAIDLATAVPTPDYSTDYSTPDPAPFDGFNGGDSGGGGGGTDW